MRTRLLLVFSILAWLPVSASAADGTRPWAFNGTRADGYTIDLVTVEPAPGTPLAAGSTVEVKVTVSYSMTIAPRGSIALIAQDERDRPAVPDASPPFVAVKAGSGQVTLTQAIPIPKKARELRIFVPLMPEGLKETSGEVTIRYPIVRPR